MFLQFIGINEKILNLNAVALIGRPAPAAGEPLGAARLWARLPLVRDHGWLR